MTTLMGSKVRGHKRFSAQDAEEPASKFDTVSFILAEEICNRTNKTHKKNSERYIYTLPIDMCG